MGNSGQNPPGFDPVQRVLAAIAEAAHRHQVSVRIHSTPEQIRTVLPPSVAVLEETGADAGWTRA